MKNIDTQDRMTGIPLIAIWTLLLALSVGFWVIIILVTWKLMTSS